MRKMFRFLIWGALIVGALIGFLRATAIRWWRVPSNDPYLTASTSPTVHGGDLIVLWRLTKPHFGSLVLCPEPNHPKRVVIGRIVGESRDELEVTGGNITINGKHIATESNCAEGKFKEHDPGTGIEVEQYCSMEDMGGGTNLRGEAVAGSVQPANVKTTVPEGYVWLVSDNRQFPWDSREFGPVLRETCTETVIFRLVGAGGFFDVSRRNQFLR